jgi:membrane protease YdiL (CAAX protease family)
MTEIRQPLPETAYPSSARPTLLTANALYLLAAVSVLLLNVFTPEIAHLYVRLFRDRSNVGLLLWVDALLYSFFFLLPVALYMRKRGGVAMRLSGVGVGTTILAFVTGVACMFLANGISALWVMLLDALGVTVQRSTIEIANENQLILGVIAIGVLPGIFEELLFRGPILAAYEKGGSRRAIFMTGLLFAMMHGSLEGFPAQFMMGLVLGYAVVSTGSIYAGMMIHTVYNAASIIVSYALRGAVDQTVSEGAVDLVESDPLTTVIGILVITLIALGIAYPMLRAFGRYRKRHAIALFPRAPLEMGVGEAIVLISGLATVLFLYADNIFHILERIL